MGQVTVIQSEKTPELLMEVLGVDEVTARFILAQERGQIDGDVEVVRDLPKPPN